MEDIEYYYSAKNNGFYAVSLKEIYDEAGSWPSDAVAITKSHYATMMKGQQEGKNIIPNNKGLPSLAEPVVDYGAKASSKLAKLMTEASTVTEHWRTELKLDMISDSDKAKLIEWVSYVGKLRGLKFESVISKAEFDSIAWPKKPEM